MPLTRASPRHNITRPLRGARCSGSRGTGIHWQVSSPSCRQHNFQETALSLESESGSQAAQAATKGAASSTSRALALAAGASAAVAASATCKLEPESRRNAPGSRAQESGSWSGSAQGPALGATPGPGLAGGGRGGTRSSQSGPPGGPGGVFSSTSGGTWAGGQALTGSGCQCRTRASAASRARGPRAPEQLEACPSKLQSYLNIGSESALANKSAAFYHAVSTLSEPRSRLFKFFSKAYYMR
jgi:hypothetical protein